MLVLGCLSGLSHFNVKVKSSVGHIALLILLADWLINDSSRRLVVDHVTLIYIYYRSKLNYSHFLRTQDTPVCHISN